MIMHFYRDVLKDIDVNAVVFFDNSWINDRCIFYGLW